MAISLKHIVVSIASRLNKRYRVLVLDNESLSQSRFWLVKPIGMIILGVFSIALIGTAFALLFVYTPLGNLLPGRANPQLEADYRDLKAQTEKLKIEVEQYGSMINSLQSVSGIPSGIDTDAGSAHGGGDPSLPGPEAGSSASNAYQPIQKSPVNFSAPILGMLHFFPPVKGEVRKTYNDRDTAEGHFGIDVISVEESMIHSIADGVVVFSEYSNQTGYVIAVMHPRYNLVSFYKHNSRLLKKPGSFVYAGESIAVIGNSGRNSTGTHLHFELWHNGEPVDPQKYIHF